MQDRLGLSDPAYDLTGNGTVGEDDTEYWLGLVGTVLGDANLDSRVDAEDLNQIGVNWNTELLPLDPRVVAAGSSWALGDFNGDSYVDARDLNSLALNWRFATDARLGTPDSEAVPEPDGKLLIFVALLLFGANRSLTAC